MRPRVTTLVLVTSLLAAAGCARAQESASVDLTGGWTGYVIMGNGTRADLVMELTQSANGYTGVLRGTDETIPEMQLRNIEFVGDSLTFEFDFPSGHGLELIRVRLRYSDEALTGSYTDPTGDSDRMHFQRRD